MHRIRWNGMGKVGNMAREKAADEIFCRSCGVPIKMEAEICPNCGVRNQEAPTSTSSDTASAPSPSHDPSEYQTNVTGSWWYGVAIGTLVWIGIFAVAGSGTVGEDNLIMSFIVLIAWLGLPIAAYYDMDYIRANGNWNPNTVVWIVMFAIFLVNVVAGFVYLYRRHEVLGVP